MRYLSLESSCDETAVAVWDDNQHKILYDQILTQIELHSPFGGVVPGIAIREHLNGFSKLLADLTKHIDLNTIDRIVVTHGPGLIGCLGIGIAYAQSLHLLIQKPLYGVNHLHGHALSPFLNNVIQNNHFSFEPLCPHLGLLASGGNTILFEMDYSDAELAFKIIAQTVDDAAGEVLDKGAKLLGLPYPGGPYIEALALNGDPSFVKFPRAFPQKTEWKFSFSGLKTSLRYYLEKQDHSFIEAHKASICASYQAAVIDALGRKVSQALQQKTYKSLGLSGGAANNNCLQARLNEIAKSVHIPFFAPPKRYCGDNAVMIAFAGSFMSMLLKLDPNRTLDKRETSV